MGRRDNDNIRLQHCITVFYFDADTISMKNVSLLQAFTFYFPFSASSCPHRIFDMYSEHMSFTLQLIVSEASNEIPLTAAAKI